MQISPGLTGVKEDKGTITNRTRNMGSNPRHDARLALFLAYAGGLAELINLGSEWATEAGIAKRLRRVILGTWVMAVVPGSRLLPAPGSFTPGIGLNPRQALI